MERQTVPSPHVGLGLISLSLRPPFTSGTEPASGVEGGEWKVKVERVTEADHSEMRHEPRYGQHEEAGTGDKGPPGVTE